MQKVYSRINWENDPSTNTPINKDNLNKMDYALDKIDDRVVNLSGYEARVSESEKNAKQSEINAKESEINAKESELKAKEYKEQAFAGTPEGYQALVEQVGLLDIMKSTAYTYPHTKPGGLRLLEMTGKTKQKTLSGKNLWEYGDISTQSSGYPLKNSPLYLKAGTYVMSFDPTIKANEDIGEFELKNGDTSVAGKVLIVGTPNGGRRSTKLELTEDVDNCTFYINNGQITVANIQIEAGEVATPYEPYCGGTPSPNPSYPQALENVGDCVEMMQGRYSSSDGTYMSSPSYICSKHKIPCKANDVVKVVCENAEHIFITGYKEDGTLSIYQEITTSLTISSGTTRFNINLSNANGLTPQTVGKISLTVNGKYVVQFVEHGKNCARINTVNGVGWGLSCGDLLRNFNDLEQGDYTLTLKFRLLDTNDKFTSYDSKYGFSLQGEEDVTVHNPWNSNAVGTIKEISCTISIKEKGKFSGFYLYGCGNYSVGFSGHADVYEIQVEKGAKTDFEPYTEKVATIFLDEQLREGDRLVKVDGVHEAERYRNKLVLDGTENFVNDGIRNNLHVYGLNIQNLLGKLIYLEAGFLCTHYMTYNIYYTNNEGKIGVYWGGIAPDVTWFEFATNFETLEEFKAYVAEQYANGTPIIIEFTATEPTYETLDPQSQLALNGLETFKDMTYLEVDSKIQPSGIEVEIGTSQVTARMLKNELRNDTQEILIKEQNARIEELTSALLVLTSETEGE